MKIFVQISFRISLLIFTTLSCHKSTMIQPELPPATQEGKEIVGCYLNGKPWLPKPHLCVMCDGYFKAVLWQNELNIHFHNYKFDSIILIDQRVEFTIISPKIGENKISNQLVFMDTRDRMDMKYYYVDTTKPFSVLLSRLDPVSNIIAGTFHFTAIEKKNRDTIRVTDGRFDAGKYNASFL